MLVTRLPLAEIRDRPGRMPLADREVIAIVTLGSAWLTSWECEHSQMSAIRNAAVAQGVISTTSAVTVYTVPAATALILKSINVSNVGPSPLTLTVAPDSPTAGAYFLLAYQVNVPSNTNWSWSGWFVMNATDLIQIQISASQATYWLSGAVLPHA